MKLVPFDNHRLPFMAQMADPSVSFYDPASGLNVSGSIPAEVNNLTPLTIKWLRGGGLVVVEGLDPKSSTKFATENEGAAGDSSQTKIVANLVEEGAGNEGEKEDSEEKEDTKETHSEEGQKGVQKKSKIPSLAELKKLNG